MYQQMLNDVTFYVEIMVIMVINLVVVVVLIHFIIHAN